MHCKVIRVFVKKCKAWSAHGCMVYNKCIHTYICFPLIFHHVLANLKNLFTAFSGDRNHDLLHKSKMLYYHSHRGFTENKQRKFLLILQVKILKKKKKYTLGGSEIETGLPLKLHSVTAPLAKGRGQRTRRFCAKVKRSF